MNPGEEQLLESILSGDLTNCPIRVGNGGGSRSGGAKRGGSGFSSVTSTINCLIRQGKTLFGARRNNVNTPMEVPAGILYEIGQHCDIETRKRLMFASKLFNEAFSATDVDDTHAEFALDQLRKHWKDIFDTKNKYDTSSRSILGQLFSPSALSSRGDREYETSDFALAFRFSPEDNRPNTLARRKQENKQYREFRDPEYVLPTDVIDLIIEPSMLYFVFSKPHLPKFKRHFAARDIHAVSADNNSENSALYYIAKMETIDPINSGRIVDVIIAVTWGMTVTRRKHDMIKHRSHEEPSYSHVPDDFHNSHLMTILLIANAMSLMYTYYGTTVTMPYSHVTGAVSLAGFGLASLQQLLRNFRVGSVSKRLGIALFKYTGKGRGLDNAIAKRLQKAQTPANSNDTDTNTNVRQQNATAQWRSKLKRMTALGNNGYRLDAPFSTSQASAIFLGNKAPNTNASTLTRERAEKWRTQANARNKARNNNNNNVFYDV
jgi:hypothetical protein